MRQDLLRKSLYFNVEHYRSLGTGAFANERPILEAHISQTRPAAKHVVRSDTNKPTDHCLDILRQHMMCTVDLGLLGRIWWDEAYPKAFPDFSTRRRCWDFEAVRSWAESRQVPAETPPDFLRAPRMGDVMKDIP